ncbi:BZ3500_MvSof-1268-A1-R1_Chr1-3g02117 [Microbotryum saponariae]|uniref:BZ3500_MvSof-1268-A1-R1_Chr1-3g02117 protein n=1 Tax=Microbotryum saponariae TaxID=289078 RepID=A0A2X0KNQ8_9BASI|nr:BZ3500_MvSof-1268-A1-R1_Chr1-3g02117 [Microbotryum saponariae]SCZ95432.1 BZ3501_MvSof-1269-A2-R1_Chr1-3g01719 [Microbotryum saponariae]
MAAQTPENVWDYPRPPALEKTPLRLRIVWTDEEGQESVLADTMSGYRVLETSHPPTYYIPPKDVNTEWLTKSPRSSFCEVSLYPPSWAEGLVFYNHHAELHFRLLPPDRKWKGQATYYNLQPTTSSRPLVKDRIWTYSNPTPRFVIIKDYLSFYATSSSSNSRSEGGKGQWKCFVGEEEVVPQEGDFYGGWKTSWIQGKMKGGPGTWGW